MVKNLNAMQETRIQSLGQEDPLEKEMATHSSTLAWRIHGQRSLVDLSPWDPKELDTTGLLTFTFFMTLQSSICCCRLVDKPCPTLL